MNAMRDNRINWIDYCKAIAIFAMVLDHVCLDMPERSRVISNFIHLWHMPLFFMLSGLVLNPDKYLGWGNFRAFIMTRTKTIILPYVCFGLLYLSFSYLFINIIGLNGTPYPLHERLRGLFWNNIPGHIGMYWFLTSLYFTEIVFVVIANLIKRKGMVVMVCAGFLLLGFLKVEIFGVTLPLTLDTLPFTLPFFCIGYYVKKQLYSFVPGKPVLAAAGCLLLVFLLLGGSYGFNLRTFSYHPHVIYLVAIAVTLSVAVFVKGIERRITTSRLHNVLSILGKESLFVYVMNAMMIKMVLMAVPKSQITSTPVSFVVSLVAAVVVVVITVYIRKMFRWPLDIMLGKF